LLFELPPPPLELGLLQPEMPTLSATAVAAAVRTVALIRFIWR
jgi:hypothetical protein